jgi:hypothetical protein
MVNRWTLDGTSARTATMLRDYRGLRYIGPCVSLDRTGLIDLGADMPSLSEKRRDLLSRFHPPSEHDPHPSKLGVLLSDEIRVRSGMSIGDEGPVRR